MPSRADRKTVAFRLLVVGGLLFSLERGALGDRGRRAGTPDDFGELAVAAGLDRTDPVVRRRLVEAARFVSERPGGEDELLDEALRAGLGRGDPVVRGRLVQAVEERLRATAGAVEPTDAELAAHLAKDRERFREPARHRFTHVYFSRASAADPSVARALRDRVAAGEAAGEPFLLESPFGPATERDVRARFGAEVARAVASLEPGRWSDAVPSAFGVHVIRVEERTAEGMPALHEVRERVRLSLLAEREETVLATARDALRRRSQNGGR